MQSIEAIRFEVQQVGKHLKGSKKRYCWQIALKDKHHKIQLDFSFISSKVKIVVDRKVLLQNELPSNVSFQYPFTLDGYSLNVIQQGQSFQLRINNKVFSHLYIQKKTNTEFKKYEDEVKDIKVNFNHTNNQKTISLNIGALGGANMKKKKQTNQSQGWNAMAGPGSFPNYFGQNASQKSESSTNSQTSNSNKEVDLLGQQTVVQSKSNNSSQNFFQFNSSNQKTSTAQVPKAQSGNDDLFNSFTSNSNKNSVQIDFFADETKKVEAPQKNNNNSGINFNTSQGLSNINMSSFATGFGGQQQKSQINVNNFTTSNPQQLTNLSFDMFANSNSNKPQQNAYNFSKKQTASQQINVLTQLDNLNLNPTPAKTDINQLYNSSSQNHTPNIDLNDFSTMQQLFQTTSGGLNFANNPQQGTFATNNQQKAQFTTNSQPQQNQFSTSLHMQQLFSTNTPAQQQQFSLNNQSQSFITNSQPQSFATNGTNGLGQLFATNNQAQSIPIDSQAQSFTTNSQTQTFTVNNQPQSFATNGTNGLAQLFATNNPVQSNATFNQAQSFGTNSQAQPFATNSQQQFTTSSQLQQMFATNTQQQPINNKPLQTSQAQNINLNDYSTMQQLFQTNSAGLNFANSYQPQQFASNSQQLNQTAQFTQPPANINLNTIPSNSGLDFSLNKKQLGQFNTLSGALNMQSNNINQNKFSTLQFNQNPSSLDFNFGETKPKTAASNDLI